MGYESTLIIGHPTPHVTDHDGHEWLKVTAVLEVGKCYDDQFVALVRDAPTVDVYWYAVLGRDDTRYTRDPHGQPLKQLDFTATTAALLSGVDPTPQQYAAAAALAAFGKVPWLNLYHYGH